MEQALTLNGPILDTNLAKLKETKSSVIKEMRNKVNSEELRLVLERLKEIGIPVTGDYKNIQELKTYLKKNLVQTDYQKAEEIITKVDKEFDRMITALENGSTNAFTRIMTGDLSTSIAKSLGLSLTGNALLVLAPTLGTKALVGAGLGTYSLIKAIKNKKEIKKINTNNELNNIIFELEITKDGDKIIDTRFPKKVQKEIRDFFRKYRIYFEDTGYLSLKTAVYNLDYDRKLELANLINAKLGRGIDVEGRLEQVKKKLNVIASTVGTTTAGLKFGINIANTSNDVSPAILGIPINGVIFETIGTYLANTFNKPWIERLCGFFGTVGASLFGVLTNTGKMVFAAENLLVCGALGITGGLITTKIMSIISAVRQIKANKKNKKEIAEYNQVDNEKYQKENAKEFKTIKEKITQKSNPEAILIDIVIGSLRDNNIVLKGSPDNLQELTSLINELPKEDKKVARRILENVDTALKNNKELVVQKLSQIATYISVLTLSGFSALSIYDIVKGGKLLPELSKKLFPKNNVHTPVAEAFNNNSPTITQNLSEVETNTYVEKYHECLRDIYQLESKAIAAGDKFDYQSYISSNIERVTQGMKPDELEKFYTAIQTYEVKNPQYKQAAIEKLTQIIYAKGNPVGERMYNELSGQAVTTDLYNAAIDEHFTSEKKNVVQKIFPGIEAKQKSDIYDQTQLQSIVQGPEKTYIPSKVLSSYLDNSTPDEIMALKHYVEAKPDLDPEIVESISSKINRIIEDALSLQRKNDRINKVASIVGQASVPIATAKAVRTTAKTRDNTSRYTR